MASDDSFYILQYSTEAVQQALSTNEGIDEDGIEAAFDVRGEMREREREVAEGGRKERGRKGRRKGRGRNEGGWKEEGRGGGRERGGRREGGRGGGREKRESKVEGERRKTDHGSFVSLLHTHIRWWVRLRRG